MSSYSFKHFFSHSEVYKYFINLGTQIKQHLSELFLVKLRTLSEHAMLSSGCCTSIRMIVSQSQLMVYILHKIPWQSSGLRFWFHWVCNLDLSIKCNAPAFHLWGWISAKDSVRWHTQSNNPEPLYRTQQFLLVLPFSAAFSILNHPTDIMESTQWLKRKTGQC